MPLAQRQTDCAHPAIASLSLIVFSPQVACAYLSNFVPSRSGTARMDAYSYLTARALRYQRNHGGEPNVRDVWLTTRRSKKHQPLGGKVPTDPDMPHPPNSALTLNAGLKEPNAACGFCMRLDSDINFKRERPISAERPAGKITSASVNRI
jgi:hypothetical protein